MSAWLLGTDQMTLLRNKLAFDMVKEQRKDEPTAIKEANRIVMSFNRMNRYAIACRYGDKSKPVKLKKFDLTMIPSNAQFLKSLECLIYQCSEGDTDKKCRTTWNRLQKLTNTTARAVAWDHPEVKAANWG